MAKKITINKGDEEIELTEKEEQIYDCGHSDGWYESGAWAIILLMAVPTATYILFLIIRAIFK